LQQNVDLIQEYNSIIDEFKKRHGMLVDVAEKTQLKIKQVTGLRDGVSATIQYLRTCTKLRETQISTITNVVDTQTALADNQTTIQQGNNIRTLTYITIAYLPLGFITVSPLFTRFSPPLVAQMINIPPPRASSQSNTPLSWTKQLTGSSQCSLFCSLSRLTF